MRPITCGAVILSLLWAAVALAEPPLKTYKGAWFDVKYPPTFTVKPRQKSTSGEGYDAVSFLSPDQSAEFYVYSPQWSGEPLWIKKAPGEKTLSYSKQKAGNKVIIYVTLQGPSYTRSYADIRQPDSNTRWTFGFKYRNQAAYDKYRPLYLKFKESLQQYAD